MEFNNFIKKEFNRLFSNLPYKMEAETSFLNSINLNTFFHIDKFKNGLIANLYNEETQVDTHISLFNNNNVKKYFDKINIFNIKVLLVKKKYKFGHKYDIIFLIQKPVIKKIYKGGANLIKYPLNYTNQYGGSIIDKFTNIFTKSKNNDKHKSKNHNKHELKNVIINNCESFDNLYKNILNTFFMTISNISEVNLVQNIFFIYYIVLFQYVLPNLYYNFKNVKKIEKTTIDFKSLIESNKLLSESLHTIFFLEKDDKLYNKMNFIKNNIVDIPYQLGDIDTIISKYPLIYKN